MPSSADVTRSSLGEEAIVFDCGGQHLIGILHHAASTPRLGILIVTGGPQYRIGSHRQFLLLARAFAAAGFPTLRFDYRGTGDSEGPFRGFEHIEADIEAAIDALFDRTRGVERVVLWGLCDAASAILLYAARDPRIAGLLLVNPWVREPDGEARAFVKHYYGRRLLDAAFWRKLLAGDVAVGAALRGLAASITGWLRSTSASRGAQEAATLPLSARMAQGLSGFQGPVGLILSGRDLTAREFEDAAAGASWRSQLAAPRITRHDLPAADHTFSRRVWREDVTRWTLSWLHRIEQ